MNAKREFIHQLPRPRISMRLENNDGPASAGTVFCRGERCEDLGRMMAVVVDDRYPAGLTFELESSVGILEYRKMLRRSSRTEFRARAQQRSRPKHCKYYVCRAQAVLFRPDTSWPFQTVNVEPNDSLYRISWAEISACAVRP